MKSKLFSILVLILLLIGISFGSGLRLDSQSTSPNVVTSGMDFDLNLRVQSIQSTGESSSYSYELELQANDRISKDNLILINDNVNIGRLGFGEFWNARFSLKVKEGAPSATYPLDVLIKRYYEGALISTMTASVNVEIIGNTFFALDSKDRTIQQGLAKDFEVSLKNVAGGSSGNIEVIFSNTDAISVVGTNSFYFSSLNSFEEALFNITLFARENLPSGTYTFPVTVSFTDGIERRTQVIEAGVIVGGNIDLKVASIETSPREVKPGDNFVLVTLNLENSGEDSARSVSAHLTSEDLLSSYSDDNQVYTGRIDSGSFSTLKFYVDVPKNVTSGRIPLTLNLEYENLFGEIFEENLDVFIAIKEKPILEIVGVEAVGKAGSNMQVKLVIENQGEQKAQEVDVRIISDSSLPFSIEQRSVYLGAIESGDTREAIFNIKISPDADFNKYSLRANLRARGDSDAGDKSIYVYDRDFLVAVDGKALNLTLIFGVILSILILFGLLFNKKAKKSKKKEDIKEK